MVSDDFRETLRIPCCALLRRKRKVLWRDVFWTICFLFPISRRLTVERATTRDNSPRFEHHVFSPLLIERRFFTRTTRGFVLQSLLFFFVFFFFSVVIENNNDNKIGSIRFSISSTPSNDEWDEWDDHNNLRDDESKRRRKHKKQQRRKYVRARVEKKVRGAGALFLSYTYSLGGLFLSERERKRKKEREENRERTNVDD